MTPKPPCPYPETPWSPRLRAFGKGESPLTNQEKEEINMLSDGAPLATDKMQRDAFRQGYAKAGAEVEGKLLPLLKVMWAILGAECDPMEIGLEDEELALLQQVKKVVEP